jgi:acyl-coenzyme A thioesterase PaaI-like protein
LATGTGKSNRPIAFSANHNSARYGLRVCRLLADAAVLTVEFKTNLIAPAQGDYFLFRACVLKPGRTITVCDAQAFAVREEKEKLVAIMTGTLMASFGREGVAH